MAISQKQQDWWRQQGYNTEPGVPRESRGTSGEALLIEGSVSYLKNRETPEIYEPTPSTYSSWDGHPRTIKAEYYANARIMTVYWGDGGAPYDYFDVSKEKWRSFKNVKSPGRWVNRNPQIAYARSEL